MTIKGVTESTILVGSAYALIRAGDDIEATLNDRERSLVSQSLDKINSYLSHDPRTLTDNLITSTDLAMIVVEVGPGFVYAIRGKQVLQQTENAIRTGGIAASISDKISDGGKYIGEVEDLTAALRKIEGKGSTWLRKIADRFDASPASVNLIAEDDVYEAIAIANRVPRRSDAFITDGGTMYLRRSRGADILRDFAHEGTHALDIARGGMFKTVGSEWYAERLASMSPEQIFKREFRAYRIGDLVGDKPRFTSRKELVDHILSQYKFAMEP